MKDSWSKAKKCIGEVELVRKLVEAGLDDLRRGKRNKRYTVSLDGKHRRRTSRGEGKIEKELLIPKECVLIKDGKCIKNIRFGNSDFWIGGRKKGNVRADLFGLDDKDSPVCGEVKETADNPWYAVVECVKQVTLLRSDRKYFKDNVKNIAKRGTGSWGMVVAPAEYWKKEEFAEAKRLVEYLRKTTKVRICCSSFKNKELLHKNPVELKVECGLPPYCK